MTTKTIKLIAFFVLLVHGIGNIQGVIAGTGVKFTQSTSNISWLLKGLGDNSNRIICIILFLGSAIFSILTALSFKEIIFSASNWQVLAVITAIVSSLSLILFPNALAMFFNKAGASLVNLIIFYSILLNGQWPSAIFED